MNPFLTHVYTVIAGEFKVGLDLGDYRRPCFEQY